MIDTYFRAILAMLRASPIVQSHNVTFDKRGPHAGYVRGDVFFADDSQLHFREFVSTQFGADRFVYVYHYQTATVVDDCMAAFGGTDGLAAKATYIFGDDGKIRQVGGMGEGAGWDSYQNWILSATNWMTPLKELNYGVTAQGSRLGIGHARPWNQRNSRCRGVSSLPRKGCAPG